MTGCEFAACRKPATVTVDGWEFCGTHARVHRDLQDDADAAAFARLPGFPRPQRFHGSAARARQHYRDGEPPCRPCLLAQELDEALRRGERLSA